MRETTIGLAACAALILVGIAVNKTGIGANNRQRVLEATVEMERLATKLDHVKKIALKRNLRLPGLLISLGTTAFRWLVPRRLRRAIVLLAPTCGPFLKAVRFPPS